MTTFLKKLPIITTFGSVFSTTTFKQTSITFSGTIINGLLGALFYILTARFLGPAAFGLMSVAVTTLTLVADIGDLGSNTGIVNFIPRYLNEDKTKALRFLKLGLEVKLFVALTVFILGWFLSPYISSEILLKPELSVPLKIVFSGVGFSLLFSFIISTLQAFQRFWSWSILQIATNSLRVILVLSLIYLGSFTLNNNLLIYIVVPFIGFTAGLLLIPRQFLSVTSEKDVAKEFFKYNKWVALFTIIAAIGARIDTYISARLLTSTQLGFYSASLQLVQVVPQIVVSIHTVVAPKMASMGKIEELVKYIKKTQIMVLGLAGLGLLSIPLVILLIPILYGPEYVPTIPIFVVHLFAMLVFLISVPVHMAIFYYFSYPKLFFWLSFVQLILVSSLSFFLIPEIGVIGAALAVLVGQVFNFTVPLIWLLKRINQFNN